MKTNLKRIICAIFAFAMLVCALSACSGSTGTDSTAAPANKVVSNDDPVVSATTGNYTGEWAGFDPYATISDSIKGQTVRFATWIDHTKTEGANALANFYRDTGLNVELFTVTQGLYVEKIITSIASNDIPDAFKTNEGKDSFPLTLQIAAPIDKVSTVNLDEPIWHKSLLETGTIDGHVYLVNTIGSPWTGSNLVFYNKKLFEENGFTTPEQYYEQGNWTWATMEKAMKEIKSLGPDYFGGVLEVDMLGDSAGASFCMYDYKTATFSSGVNKKELLMTYQWYNSVREQGLLGNGRGDFANGKAGICITGVYGLKNTGYFKDMDFNDIGFTYLPALEDGSKGKTSAIYRMYGIVAGAPNADAAGYFLRYWLDPANYDLNNTFISNKAGNFYFELTDCHADEKYFNFDDVCGTFVGAKDESVFNGDAKRVVPGGVKTKLDAVSNKVDDAVKKANQMIQDLKNKYK